MFGVEGSGFGPTLSVNSLNSALKVVEITEIGKAIRMTPLTAAHVPNTFPHAVIGTISP